MSKVRITGKGIGTKIEIDGQPVNGCFAYRLRQRVSGVASLVLHVHAVEVEVDVEGEVMTQHKELRHPGGGSSVSTLNAQIVSALKQFVEEYAVLDEHGHYIRWHTGRPVALDVAEAVAVINRIESEQRLMQDEEDDKC